MEWLKRWRSNLSRVLDLCGHFEHGNGRLLWSDIVWRFSSVKVRKLKWGHSGHFSANTSPASISFLKCKHKQLIKSWKKKRKSRSRWLWYGKSNGTLKLYLTLQDPRRHFNTYIEFGFLTMSSDFNEGSLEWQIQ